ncbi:proteasome activator [Candidatus Poriferisodalis sp.]|uniref:proteasome activator n=1 Tax=Candidatus Poriferisodalis sp. TaxID=3101277 RepID=UPI003B5A41B3
MVVGDSVQDPEQGELLNSGPLTEDVDDEPFVPEPAKLMRIGGMIRKLLEEVRHAELDEAGRDRMRDVYHLSVEELATALSEPLADELNRIALPFEEDIPSGPELRIAQAQLVGWLEGLFHGIQAAVSAQQMMAERQLRSMRGNALEAGEQPGPARTAERGGVYL